jgi:hypothetical protein
MFDEVNLNEYPALTDLRSRYLTRTRLVLERDGMNLQERSGLLQSERTHVASAKSTPSLPVYLLLPRRSRLVPQRR